MSRRDASATAGSQATETNVRARDEIRSLLARYGHRPRHGLGQHFLVDDRVYERILTEAAPHADTCIVEIGAGLGTLTRRLVRLVPAGRLVALERDPQLCDLLRAELGAEPACSIVQGDAVTYDYKALAAHVQQRLLIVGNIPYSISGPLLARLLDLHAVAERVILLMQREVGERILASPATKAYGILTVLLAVHFEISPVLRVGPQSFFPPPKVDSLLVRLTPRPSPRVHLEDEGLFRRIVRAAFGQRRKTLRNALEGCLHKEDIERVLQEAGVDGHRRGETLSVEEFARLANIACRCTHV